MGVDIDIGAGVWAADGRQVGIVSGVVVDPANGKLTHLVVRYGFAVTLDKVVPMGDVSRVADHRIRLAISLEEVDGMPDLEAHANIPLGGVDQEAEGEHAPSEFGVWGRMPPVVLPPLISDQTNVQANVVEEWRNLPEQSLVLREGMPVRGRDGAAVGNLDELVTDPHTYTLTHIVVRRGTFRAHDKAIPVGWIERSDEDTGITLAVPGRTVEELPNYH